MGRRNYSEETKAAVMAALLAGQSTYEVADKYNIPEGTVKSWKKREINGGGLQPVATINKREQIGELIIDLLVTELKMLKKMAEIFGDENWIKKQSASEVGVMYGVMQDKAFRKLEALSRAPND